jgi:cytochrome c553
METFMKKALILFAGLSYGLMSGTATAAGDAAAGKEISAKNCVACHMVDGNSTDPNFPRLAGQHADYIVKELEDYKSGARKNPIMNGLAATLSKQDREDLAAYFASQADGLFTIEATK